MILMMDINKCYVDSKIENESCATAPLSGIRGPKSVSILEPYDSKK